MAWHDEYPHKVYASVLLLDGKIEGWKIGNPPKREPGEFKAYWKKDRLNDYTVEYVGFEVNNDKEHSDAFKILAPKWFRQWELAEDLHGSPPYSDKIDKARSTRNEILAMVPGPEMDEAIGKLVGATPRIKYFAMNKEETAYYIDFDLKSLADDWHNDKVQRFPNGSYVRDGGHIVRKEIYRRYSEDIAAAWEVVRKMGEQGLYIKIIDRHAFIKVKFYKLLELVDLREWAEAREVPEAICKAALLAQVKP